MAELGYLVAIVVAFGASFANASHNLFVRLGTEHRDAADAFLVVITISALTIVPGISILYYPDYGLTVISWISFVLAGIVGSIFGMVLLYASIERIGASRATPIVASQALIATVLGIVFLDESLALMHGIGIVVIVLGVAVIAWETSEKSEDELSRRGLLVSLLLPLGAALAFGLEPILANFGFTAGTPAPVGLAIKTAAAWVGFVLYLWWRDRVPTQLDIRETNTHWLVLAGLGYTLFLVGYYVGLEIAPVNIVMPIIITNTLFVVALSALFMPQRLERVTRRLVVASVIVIIGAILVTAFR